jgi:hypothetical protein
MRKKYYLLILILSLFISTNIKSDNNDPVKKTFSKSDIEKLADAYVNNNVHATNPVIIDIDKDGKFDLLVFNKGNVEYYRNTGTLDKPFFVLENAHYDKYKVPDMLPVGLPCPIFFADNGGKGKLDMYAVTKLDFNPQTNEYNYRILHAENALNLDQGTLITIILVLVIVLLVLAIIH